MEIQYVKRYRMAFDLHGAERKEAVLPDGFFWIAWNPRLTDIHGRLTHQSFQGELDSVVFPTFTRLDACLRLMRCIASNRGFLPKGTWLIAKNRNADETLSATTEFCATIQGIRSDPNVAAIQNIAVRPEFRHIGLGRALVLKSLEGFYRSGCDRVTLEATAENLPAVRLYQKLGFEVTQTIFREVFY